MKKVIKYKCDHCSDLFDSEELCLKHENRHRRINKANQMLDEGYTFKQIQDECNIWYEIPKHLENVNKDNCFIISWWQCCNKPAYRIDTINMNGEVRVWGCGSWSGYYGNYVQLTSHELKNPRPKEELFVDKRYTEKLKQYLSDCEVSYR